MSHYDLVPRLPYLNPQDVVQHLDQALSRYKFLRCKVDLYTSEIGNQTNLLHLSGTVPILFQGNSYNIPVCVWILSSFPNEAPVCFVVPTEHMIVKNGRYVDSGGRVYLPGLSNWVPRMSRLIQILDDMCNVFSMEPPLLSKPAGYVAPPPPMARPIPPQQPPPPQQQQHQQPPGQGQGQWPVWQGINLESPTLASGSMSQPGGAPSVVRPFAQPAQPAQPPRPSLDDQEKLERMRANFNSDIKASLTGLKSEMETSAVSSLSTADTLKSRSEQLQALMRQMEADMAALNAGIAWYTERNQALGRNIDAHITETGVDVDSAIIATAPLYNQIMNLKAEDQAYTDLYYELRTPLMKKRMDLEKYIKTVREISYNQFMVRSLIKKCIAVATQGGVGGARGPF